MTQNKKELVLAALNNQPVDRVPVGFWFHFTEVAERQLGLSNPEIIVKNVFPYVLAGVGIGAFLHNWVPQEWILALLGGKTVWGVLLATLIGVPIYADIFGTLPIAEALYLAQVPVGTILALMMSITTLSLPSLIMLSKVMTRRLLFTFIGIVVGGIVFIGYFFNMVW